MPPPTTPRSVVLNLVRVAERRSVAVRQLLEVGALFGFNTNATRVAVARLVADRLLESDERGSYRLGPAALVVNEHVEAWRRGESRMRAWRGAWLVAMLPASAARSQRRASCRALSRLGLREGLAGLWVRPDNLNASLEETGERLRALGLEPNAELFRASDFCQQLVQRFSTELWPLRRLRASYDAALRDLERSLERLPRLPRDTALVQTFVLGGAAIRVLATDPLLPEQILNGATRAELTRQMLRYDAVGRELWKARARNSSPTSTRSVQGGARAG